MNNITIKRGQTCSVSIALDSTLDGQLYVGFYPANRGERILLSTESGTLTYDSTNNVYIATLTHSMTRGMTPGVWNMEMMTKSASGSVSISKGKQQITVQESNIGMESID